MAHNLFQNTMAYVDETPWHRLGERVHESVTSKEMCRAAGLDWAIRKEPAPGARILNLKKQTYERYLVFRDPVKDEVAPVALGLVGERYELLQNAEAFSFFEPFIESGFASFHTAGALGNGERVWVLAKIKGEMKISAEDIVDRFLLLSNSHDGTGALTIRFTPIRVVCQNTLNIALKRGSGVISIRHTRNLSQNLAKAQQEELKHVIEKVFGEAQAVFCKMAERRLSGAEPTRVLEGIFPRKDKDKEPDRWVRVRGVLNDENVTPIETKDTLWGLYNAIIRDEDYRQSRESTTEARLSRVWFGSGCDLKLQAFTACREFLEEAA